MTDTEPDTRQTPGMDAGAGSGRPSGGARVSAVLWLALLALVGAAQVTVAQRGSAPVSPGELRAAIDQLGKLDYAVRMNASRTVRRAPAEQAVPGLMHAVDSHTDGYVRFRALVLLSGFNDRRARDLMEDALDDPNDRLRAVAYTYFEHNPDRMVVHKLLAALDREESEFVRPALTRALAAYAFDPGARDAIVTLVGRGQDFFRSAAIEALGDYRATYAIDSLVAVAKLDGPLREEAALALGKIGDRRALPVLAAVQRATSRDAQPIVAAAICLLGVNCASHQAFVTESLRFAVANQGYQPLLRASVRALTAFAASTHPLRPDERAIAAAMTLFDVGVPARDPARAPIALAVGSVAIRNTPLMLAVLEKHQDLDEAVLLLRDAFDMLEEDFEEERFFATVRRAYWQAADGSATRRRVAELLIQKLEF